MAVAVTFAMGYQLYSYFFTSLPEFSVGDSLRWTECVPPQFQVYKPNDELKHLASHYKALGPIANAVSLAKRNARSIHQQQPWLIDEKESESLYQAIYVAEMVKQAMQRKVTMCGYAVYYAAARIITHVQRGVIEKMPLISVIEYNAANNVAYTVPQVVINPSNLLEGINVAVFFQNRHCYTGHAYLGVLPNAENGLQLMRQVLDTLGRTAALPAHLVEGVHRLLQQGSGAVCDLWDTSMRYMDGSGTGVVLSSAARIDQVMPILAVDWS